MSKKLGFVLILLFFSARNASSEESPQWFDVEAGVEFPAFHSTKNDIGSPEGLNITGALGIHMVPSATFYGRVSLPLDSADGGITKWEAKSTLHLNSHVGISGTCLHESVKTDSVENESNLNPRLYRGEATLDFDGRYARTDPLELNGRFGIRYELALDSPAEYRNIVGGTSGGPPRSYSEKTVMGNQEVVMLFEFGSAGRKGWFAWDIEMGGHVGGVIADPATLRKVLSKGGISAGAEVRTFLGFTLWRCELLAGYSLEYRFKEVGDGEIKKNKNGDVTGSIPGEKITSEIYLYGPKAYVRLTW